MKENIHDLNIRPPYSPIENIIEGNFTFDSPENNHEYTEQITMRKELLTNLRSIFSKITTPDMTLEQALNKKITSTSEVSKLYESLSVLIGDPEYSRIILYIPFEFLPSNKILSHNELGPIAKKFIEDYMKSWYSLLKIHDVRANFVDGDVLETILRTEDLPRVVKAAHLIPVLMQHSMISFEEINTMINQNDDNILIQSIADIVPILYDLNLLTEDHVTFLQRSKNSLISHTINKILYEREPENKKENRDISFERVKQRLVDVVNHIHSSQDTSLPQKRINWLIKRDTESVIDSMSNNLSQAILENSIDSTFIEQVKNESLVEVSIVFIEAIRKVIELLTKTDAIRAREIYEKYKDLVIYLWNKENPEIKECISKLLNRSHKLKTLNDHDLEYFNIKSKDLLSPFSENINAIKDILGLETIIANIENDPVLSQHIYPVVVLYGSKVKGYGETSADIDVAVFIKPGIDFSKRTTIQNALQSAFSHEQFGGTVTEFWLKEVGNNTLIIEDFDGSTDTHLGGSYWTHVLFNGVWEGNKSAMDELQKKLLQPYFFETDKTILEHNARQLYIEELERDVLQYRLLHKGYARFYPSYNTIQTTHTNGIDETSAFWDSGYRRLATELFASRVFLPKLRK